MDRCAGNFMGKRKDGTLRKSRRRSCYQILPVRNGSLPHDGAGRGRPLITERHAYVFSPSAMRFPLYAYYILFDGVVKCFFVNSMANGSFSCKCAGKCPALRRKFGISANCKPAKSALIDRRSGIRYTISKVNYNYKSKLTIVNASLEIRNLRKSMYRMILGE